MHSSSSQAMHYHVCSESAGKYFFRSVIYAYNDEIDRKNMGAELRLIDRSMGTFPMACFGRL